MVDPPFKESNDHGLTIQNFGLVCLHVTIKRKSSYKMTPQYIIPGLTSFVIWAILQIESFFGLFNNNFYN